MSLSQDIAPHLPYLRRFARSLCGSQASGDAYVVATLEALIADPDAFPTNVSPKVSLYHFFMKEWTSIPLNMDEPPADDISAAQRNINLLTPRSRQAFLLRTVEGFPVSDVAVILSTTESQVEKLVEGAGREIAERVATDVLIIEDESLIAQDIEFVARDLGHNIIGIARTHEEAVALAKQKRPGLILADIHLADGSSGLSAVNEMLESFDAPVIFITAFPEMLLTGERPEPAFLLSKPYKIDTLKATISQALFFDRKATRVA